MSVSVAEDHGNAASVASATTVVEVPGTDGNPVGLADGDGNALETVASRQGNTCSKCGHQMGIESQVCCNCGYYATIGKFVEIEQPKEAEEERIPWELLAIPAVCLLIIGESVAARYLTHPQSPDRQLLSVLHLVFGSLLFLIPHLRAQWLSGRESAGETGPFDFLFHPLQIWQVVLKKLPKSMPWLLAASAGLTAVVCSLIIGGLPSPFAKEPIEWTPMKRITLAAPKGGGGEAQSMEEAVSQLTEVVVEEAVDELESDKPRVYEDCAIVGYTLAGRGRIGSIVVAKKFDGVTRLVGSISKDIPNKVRVKLADRLRRIPADEPLADGVEGSNWVNPKYYCRVWFYETEDGSRGTPHFDRMLVLKKK